MTTATAGRIVNEALAFVATAARHPHTYISPSRVVDEGWHALILHTAVYAGLCEQLGTFVHHYLSGPTVAARRPGDGTNPDPDPGERLPA